jgi:hypothetical protein
MRRLLFSAAVIVGVGWVGLASAMATPLGLPGLNGSNINATEVEKIGYWRRMYRRYGYPGPYAYYAPTFGYYPPSAAYPYPPPVYGYQPPPPAYAYSPPVYGNQTPPPTADGNYPSTQGDYGDYPSAEGGDYGNYPPAEGGDYGDYPANGS